MVIVVMKGVFVFLKMLFTVVAGRNAFLLWQAQVDFQVINLCVLIKLFA